MSAYLYKNYRGVEVNSHSHSSGSTFSFCRQKYYLQKVQGWRTKGENASSKFGVAVEDAIAYYHQNGLKPGEAVDHFKFRWLQFKEVPDLIFKDKEGTWEDLYKSGSQLLALYEIMLPDLPIVKPEFQLRYSREVFPGTELAGLQDQGFVDLLSRGPWVHPLLPKVTVPPNATHRSIIVDIKTSGTALDLTPQILQLDPQLKRYASLSGVRDVAFLWFQRSKPLSFEKGTEITFLEDSGKWTKGQKAVIYEFDSEANSALITHEVNLFSIKTALAEIKGKGSGELKAAKIAEFIADAILTKVPVEHITKQKLKFVAVRMNDEDVEEENRIVAKQMVEIRQASIDNFWPKDGAGVRFPKNNCGWCEMRGHCLRDTQLRDQLLVQITNPVESDWLDDVQEEEG